eukprot:578605-Rhodomonas_salina.3
MDVERSLKADCEPNAVVASHPKGDYFVTTCEKGILKLWHVDSGSCMQLRGHARRVMAVTFSPLGEILCAYRLSPGCVCAAAALEFQRGGCWLRAHQLKPVCGLLRFRLK